MSTRGCTAGVATADPLGEAVNEGPRDISSELRRPSGLFLAGANFGPARFLSCGNALAAGSGNFVLHADFCRRRLHIDFAEG